MSECANTRPVNGAIGKWEANLAMRQVVDIVTNTCEFGYDKCEFRHRKHALEYKT